MGVNCSGCNCGQKEPELNTELEFTSNDIFKKMHHFRELCSGDPKINSIIKILYFISVSIITLTKKSVKFT